MRTELLNYDLPPELIAQQPAPMRSRSRLLVMDRATGTLADHKFPDIINYLRPGDCLVLNNTRVLPARFFVRRSTGGKLEGLFLNQTRPGRWEVMLKNARRIKPLDTLILIARDNTDFCKAKAVSDLDGGLWELVIESDKSPEEILDKIGFAPLPPYIKRKDPAVDAQSDLDRYQTIYAQTSGAIAAPTAGLHFTESLLEEIQQLGVEVVYITLHVGAGTFKPVKAENLEEHEMHYETFTIDSAAAETINRTKKEGGRIIAVGTTSVRTLESVACNGKIEPAGGSTNLFITPGYEFKIVDAMITNFHLPRSTLLALVAAFAGLDEILAAYKHAVASRYRFYSYGDAMLIL